MTGISLRNISKTFTKGRSKKTIIENLDLDIEHGEFVVFVGPSGCGKSTILRMIAGLEDITSGELCFDGDLVNHKTPSERGIGMVFQSYALYPHKTIEQNIAFPLKMAGKPKNKIRARVAEVAELLEITNLLPQKPSQLSGGQRQRVAIGRALVRDPDVFLLDEPLSNLDAALRVRMRLNLSDYHKKLGCTVVYVTHDQVEATTLADKVVVLNKGAVEQVGTPMDLYHFPRTKFVAEFIGSPKMNLFPATYSTVSGNRIKVLLGGQPVWAEVGAGDLALKEGATLYVGVRPETLQIGSEGVRVTVLDQEFMGAESMIYTRIEGLEEPLMVRCPGTLMVPKGKPTSVRFPPEHCFLFDAQGLALPRNTSLSQLLIDGDAP